MAAFVLIVLGLQFIAVRLVGSQSPDVSKSVSDVRISLIQLLGGIGVLGGFIYTVRTYALSRDTHRAERFSDAIVSLGNADSASVRTGGIYTMSLLVGEDSRYWTPTEEILCGFVREGPKAATAAPDVSAAIRVLGSRLGREHRKGRALDLRGAWLEGANMVGLDLSRALLSQANLNEADLTDAILRGTQFIEAKLKGVVFAGAKMNSANLTDADLTGAEFLNADLDSVDLTRARVAGARNFQRKEN